MGSTMMEIVKLPEDTAEIYKNISNLDSNSVKYNLLKVQLLNEQREKIREKDNVEYLDVKRSVDVKYCEIMDEIQKIVSGTNDLPTLTEAEYEEYEITKPTESSEKGIEDYWLKVVKNSNNFFYLNEKDEQILKHLSEIKINERDDKLSFAVEFYFTPNDYFTNSMLAKEYIYNTEELNVIKVTQTEIDWKSESVKPFTITKTKNKKGKTETVTKPSPSFFDFFQEIKYKDLEILEKEGDFLRESLIPFSMEYYLDFHARVIMNDEEEDNNSDN